PRSPPGATGGPSTLAATSAAASHANAAQQAARTGPALVAVAEGACSSADLGSDPRWPGPLRDRLTGWLVAHRLDVSEPGPLRAVVSLGGHAGEVDAAERAIEHLAGQLSLLVGALLSRDRARQLDTAVRTNREIGVAVGILMSVRRLRQEDAVGLLRAQSQHRNVRLADLAAEVVRVGDLPGS
ncbi:MAG: ANTAR domain-containing protein, partial [Phycicoccus sp.]